MRTHHSTLDAAIAELDKVVDTLNPGKYPGSWSMNRGIAGWRVSVLLPAHYQNQPGVSALNRQHSVTAHEAPTMLAAVNAVIEVLADLPIGGPSVLDALAVEVFA